MGFNIQVFIQYTIQIITDDQGAFHTKRPETRVKPESENV